MLIARAKPALCIDNSRFGRYNSFKPEVSLAAVRSTVVVLLLLIHCSLFLTLFFSIATILELVTLIICLMLCGR